MCIVLIGCPAVWIFVGFPKKQFEDNHCMIKKISHNNNENIKDGNNIRPKPTSKVLGITFSSNLTWTHHLEKGTDAILSKCKQKLAALKYVASGCTLKQKKLLADACIMSRITYGIQIWGIGPTNSVIRIVKTLQNLVG